jgi:nucleotide-binding universal stress UspA family protein
LWAQGVKATWQAVSDTDPAAGILRFASDLPGAVVVMSSHGRTGLRRLALGSVTARVGEGAVPLDVLAHSPHPVLVVPAATPAAEAVR